ncbi:MAG: oxidoreductase [Burkholderiaceae bacterium]
MTAPRKPRLGVFKFASCDGCQLSLLDCEDELLAIADALEIAYFPEATRGEDRGRYDIALVEGSITTPGDAARIVRVRKRARLLVTIGACATSGGIQALRNFANVDEYARAVYPSPQYLDVLAHSTPIADHVRVDHELRGCPISKVQLVELIAALLNGRAPPASAHAVCIECKLAGAACVLVAHGTPCLGPVTHAGCGALCPRHDRGCYGCFGPQEAANAAALRARMLADGAHPQDVRRMFAGFNVNAPAFRAEGLEPVPETREEPSR